MDVGWGHPNCRCVADRVDETLDEEEIAKQAKEPNVEWSDVKQVAEYSKDFRRAA